MVSSERIEGTDKAKPVRNPFDRRLSWMRKRGRLSA